jgi:hypothetical protein
LEKFLSLIDPYGSLNAQCIYTVLRVVKR